MENFDAKQYRQDLAKELQETPKEERQETLEIAQKDSDYWKARSEKIHQNQEEEIIDGGLGVFVKNKALYHGTSVDEIENFNKAENATVGDGVYLTSEGEKAVGYARLRLKRAKESKPIIYEVLIENMKLLDLRTNENVKKILTGFKDVLSQKTNLNWYQDEVLRNAISAINNSKFGPINLRDVVNSFGRDFSEYCKSLGYDGLITYEGGEGSGTEDIGSHDTYLIFDPTKVKINQKHEIL